MVIYGQLTKSDAPVVWCSQCLKDTRADPNDE